MNFLPLDSHAFVFFASSLLMILAAKAIYPRFEAAWDRKQLSMSIHDIDLASKSEFTNFVEAMYRSQGWKKLDVGGKHSIHKCTILVKGRERLAVKVASINGQLPMSTMISAAALKGISKVTQVILVTNASATPAIEEEAAKSGVLLIDRVGLNEKIRGLRRRASHAKMRTI
jgi:HJR/Mrr/RecB family endonuclease